MPAIAPRLTSGTSAANEDLTTPTPILLSPSELQAIELYQNEGQSIARIMQATGLPERRVKELTKALTKPIKPKNIVTKTQTPLAKAAERVFELASRTQGIRDYELREILHEEYGSKWDTTTGKYVSNYSQSTIRNVKEKVRHRSATEDCNVLFVMDWVDGANPTASRQFLEDAATELLFRVESYVDEFMQAHGVNDDGSAEASKARKKQRYAAERHLLKMSVRDLSPEPLDTLLERSVTITDALEGSFDASLRSSTARAHGVRKARTGDLPYYPEPSRNDFFLDFVESQGWIKEVESRFR